METRDRLIELLKQIDFDFGEVCVMCAEDGYKCHPPLAEFFADHLIANGVIVPPCKVGQTVYYIAFAKVYKGKCHAITQHRDSLQIHLYDYDRDSASISAKNVFLTKEEAENALKERVYK